MGGRERCGRSQRFRCWRILRITSGCSTQAIYVKLHLNLQGLATGGDPQDPPASESVGAATTFSPAQAVSSQAGNLYGFSLSPAGSRNPSLHRFGFLGRGPGLERLKSQGSSLLIQYPCAFFSLFSHSFLPHLLSHNLRAGSACYSHYPAPK